jgi:hypothetical protein
MIRVENIILKAKGFSLSSLRPDRFLGRYSATPELLSSGCKNSPIHGPKLFHRIRNNLESLRNLRLGIKAAERES